MLKILVLIAGTYMGGEAITVAPGVYDAQSCEEAGKAWSATRRFRTYECLPSPSRLR